MFDSELELPIELLSGERDDELYRLTVAELDADPSTPDRGLQCLEMLAPGPVLAAALSSIDITTLTGFDVVNVLRAHQRQLNHYQGRVYDAMAETAHCKDEDTIERTETPMEYALEEIESALTLTRRKAEYELGVALDLRQELTEVGKAVQAGDIDGRKAALMSRDTGHLPAKARGEVVERLLGVAPDLTTGQISALLRRLTIETDPDAAESLRSKSLSERMVVAEPNLEGTAALIISQCSPDQVYAARDRINILAQRLKTADEPRAIDQLRADVALGLLTGSIQSNGTKTGAVNITVDLTTLAELDQHAGELAGYGPITSELARKIAFTQTKGTWTATVTDPETGEPLDVVSIRRRPTAKQTHKIRALHPTCACPGCRMPAVDSDLDHTIDYAKGGETTVRNSAPLCRRHHRAKHRGGWRYRKVTRTQIEWNSPLGHTYRIEKPP